MEITRRARTLMKIVLQPGVWTIVSFPRFQVQGPKTIRITPPDQGFGPTGDQRTVPPLPDTDAYFLSTSYDPKPMRAEDYASDNWGNAVELYLMPDGDEPVTIVGG